MNINIFAFTVTMRLPYVIPPFIFPAFAEEAIEWREIEAVLYHPHNGNTIAMPAIAEAHHCCTAPSPTIAALSMADEATIISA